MSDTTTLQVVVDPNGAVAGANTVTNAIGNMSNSSGNFLNKLNSQFQSLTSFIDKATGSLSDFLKVLVAIDTIKSLLDRMIEVNVVYNQFVATMTMVTGSSQKARQEFQYLSDYANKMGANVEETAKIYGRLAAALKAFDSTGETTHHIFEAIAQAQSVLHLKGYETNGIFLALEQSVSKGKISLEEFQRQLGNRLPDAMGLASRAMSMTQQEFRTAITKGSLDALQTVIKVANQIKIEYGDSATAAADMFTGQMNRMKNAVFNLYLAVGQTGAMDGLTKVVKALTDLLNDPNVGGQLGSSLGEFFSQIADWIRSITKQDVKDFFDGISVVVKTLNELLKQTVASFSDVTDGKADILSFADAVTSGLLIISDVALTVVAAIRSIPLALQSSYVDAQLFVAKGNPARAKAKIFGDNSYEANIDALSNESKRLSDMNDKNDAIIFGTDKSPTSIAWKKKDDLIAKLRADRAANPVSNEVSTGYTTSGRPLTDEEIARLSANGAGAPGSTSKRDVFNSESVALGKASALAVLEYNNLMNDKIKLDSKNSTQLEAKIQLDKDYKSLSADQLSQLRAMAAQADQDQSREKAAETFVANKMRLNEQIYASQQQLNDVLEHRSELEEKNQRALIQKMTFDVKYISMSSDMKASLLNQAMAVDALSVAIDNANKVEKSRYETLVNTLQVTRDITNMQSGLGANRYNQADSLNDTFLPGGSNQFVTDATKTKLMADAIQRDMNAIAKDTAVMSFNLQNRVKDMEFETSLIGKTSIEIQKLTEKRKLEEQFRLNGIDLSKEENAKYRELVSILSDEMSLAIDKVAAKQMNWGVGFSNGIAKYIDDISSAAKGIEDAVVKSFKGMEDQLVSFVMTGKTNFHDLTKSILSDIARIVIQMEITGPIAQWFHGPISKGGFSNMVSGSGDGGGDGYSGSGSLGMVSNGMSIYNMGTAASGMMNSGTMLGWATGASSVAPTSVMAANAVGAVGGDSIGTLIASEGWGGAAASGALTATATGSAAAGTASGGIMAGMSSALAAIPVWGWILLAIIAFKDKLFGQKVVGSGISGSVTDGDNFQGNLYQFKKGGWFRGDSTEYSAMPDELTQQLSLSTSTIKTTFTDLGKSIGAGTDLLKNYHFEFRLALADFDAAGKAQAVQRLMTTMGDSMANAFVDSFRTSVNTAEQAANQYYTNTVDGERNFGPGEVVQQSRPSTELDPYIDDMISIFDNFKAKIAGKDGMEGSIAAFVTQLFQLGDAMVKTGGFAETFGAAIDFKQLEAAGKTGESVMDTFARLNSVFTATNTVAIMLGKDMATAFGQIGLDSTEARQRLINLSGGSDSLSSKLQFFTQNFLTPEEQMAPVIKSVTSQLAALGYTGIDTTEKFKNIVMALDLTTEAGQQTFNSLMNLAPAVSQVMNYESNSKHRQLETTLMDLQGNSLNSLNAQRANELATLDSSTRELQSRVWALQDARDAESKAMDNVSKAQDTVRSAYERESGALTTYINKFRDYSKNLRSYNDSLLVGGLSTGSPETVYTDLKSQFDQTYSLAKSGDETALSNLQSISGQFLQASRAYNGSTQRYTNDFNYVRQALTNAANAADTQADISQQQLNAMTQSVSQLISINSNVIGLQTAISQLASANAALLAASKQVTSLGGTPKSLSSFDDLGPAGGGPGWSNNDAYSHPSGVSVLDSDSPIITAAKVLYESTKGGVSTAQYNNAMDAIGGVSNLNWNGDPDSLRATYHFAKGAAFTNGIVTRPTNFNIGQMGESSFEAIMPLTNTSNGLGVHVTRDSDDPEVSRLIEEMINTMKVGHKVSGAGDVAIIEKIDQLISKVNDVKVAIGRKSACTP